MTEQTTLRREIEFEAALTRLFLRRLHELDLGWTPSQGTWSLGQLAAHLAVIPYWGLAILRLDRHDMALATGWSPPTTVDLETIERDFETHTCQLLQVIESVDLDSIWTFARGSEVIASLSRASAIRHYVLGHLAHHRGQLALYLRLSRTRVPASYGSSRDEAPIA